jgi:CubicO group peptidase (beta-lactamase class C family)
MDPIKNAYFPLGGGKLLRALGLMALSLAFAHLSVQAQTRFAASSNIDANLKERLTEMSAVELTLPSAAFADADSWALLSDMNGFYAAGVTSAGYAGAFDTLIELRSAGHSLKHIAFAPTGGHWVILYNTNDFATSSGFGSVYPGPQTHMTNIRNSNSELKDIVFPTNGGVLILSGKNGYWSQGFGAAGYQDVLDRLAELQEQNRTLRSVSVSPTGARMVLHGTNGYWAQQVPSALFSAVVARAEAGHTLNRVILGPNSQWVLLYEWKDAPLPVTGPEIGIPSTALDPIDDIIVNFMEQHGINAALAAIMRNNSIVYHRGFGWLDQSLGIPMPHDGVMRIASLSKPMTASVVRWQIEQGQYQATDPLFDINGNGGLLPINPFPVLGDPRLEDVTVEHALQHRGGWDRNFEIDDDGNTVGDITRREITVGWAMNVPMPPNRSHVSRWMLGQPLQFDPGAEDRYSNVGYFYLGYVIEKYAFQNYVAELRDLLAPAGVQADEIIWGATRREDHDPREPWYFDTGMATNRFAPDNSDDEVVNAPYGGWVHEHRISQGGLVITTHAMLRMMQSRIVSGDSIGALRNPATESSGLVRTHTGGLPGTATVATQRGDGISLVVFFNRRTGTRGWSDSYAVDIRDLIFDAIDSGSIRWPAILNPSIFGSSVGDEKGYKNSPLLGRFWSFSFADKWIHHGRFKWIYCEGSEETLFFWNKRHGWHYTGLGIYPRVYSYGENKWLLLDESDPQSLWVYDYARQMWRELEPWE